MLPYDEFLFHSGLSQTSPSLSLLREVYSAFTRIPYENATKIIKKHAHTRRFRMPEELFHDYVTYGAGGTCFSLVYALFKLLQHLRFDAHLALADRIYGENTHTCILASLGNDQILLDPGFLVPCPIPLPPSWSVTRIPLPMNELIIQNEENGFRVSTLRGEKQTFRYFIKNKVVSESEYMTAWESSFEFKMIQNVFFTRLTPRAQIYMRERRVEIITREERSKYMIQTGYSSEIQRLIGLSPQITEELLIWHRLKPLSQ